MNRRLPPEDREALKAVETLLWEQWVPVSGLVPRDEYDSYAGVVFGRLRNGASEADIADYLRQVEQDQVGWETSEVVRAAVAARAAAIVRPSSP